MPTHAEKRFLPFSQEQLFNLVADVEIYPEFLPWCIAVRVTHRDENTIRADLMVGFKMVREKFTSKVTLLAPDRIDVVYLDGPFRYLNNHWIFEPRDGGCEIDFFIDFEFRSRLLQAVATPIFNEAVRRMVGAFEARAEVKYATNPPAAGLSEPI